MAEQELADFAGPLWVEKEMGLLSAEFAVPGERICGQMGY